LRFTNEIMQIYYFYSSFNCPVEIQSLKLTLGQVWQLVADCNLLCAMVTRADISRLVSFHLLNSEGHPAKVDAERLEGVHDPSVIVLMREFAEFLVRLAEFCFQNHPDIVGLVPETEALPARVKYFLTHLIIPRARTANTAATMPAYIRPKHDRKVAGQMIEKYRDLLQGVFLKHSTSYIDPCRGNYRLNLEDRYMTVRKFLSLLRERDILDDVFTLVRAALFLSENDPVDMDSHLESSIVFEEFCKKILACGFSKRKMHQLFEDQKSKPSTAISEGRPPPSATSVTAPTPPPHLDKKRSTPPLATKPASRGGDGGREKTPLLPKKETGRTKTSGGKTKSQKTPARQAKNQDRKKGKDTGRNSARGELSTPSPTMPPTHPPFEVEFLNHSSTLERSQSADESQILADIKKLDLQNRARRRTIVCNAPLETVTNRAVGPGEWTVEEESADGDQFLLFACEDILRTYLAPEVAAESVEKQAERKVEPRTRRSKSRNSVLRTSNSQKSVGKANQ
jgi:hypothetical protein